MEHVLTIASSPGAGTEPDDEPFHLAAYTNVGAFEDQGFPEIVTGKLLEVPEPLLENVRNAAITRVELGGQTYALAALDSDGTFELRKYRRAQVLPAQI